MARYVSNGASVLEEGRDVEIVLAAGAASCAGQRLRPAFRAVRGPPAAAAEARGDDGDPDLAGQPVVDGRAEDDVRLVGGGAADRLGGLVHLDEREVVAACDR